MGRQPERRFPSRACWVTRLAIGMQPRIETPMARDFERVVVTAGARLASAWTGYAEGNATAAAFGIMGLTFPSSDGDAFSLGYWDGLARCSKASAGGPGLGNHGRHRGFFSSLR